MHGAAGRQRGFTAIEVVVVATLMSMAVAVFMRNYTRVQDFADHQRANMRNLVEQQRCLRTLEAVLQAVDPTTITGFDTGGVATTVEFQRWLHDPVDGVALGPVERLHWLAGGDPVGDVTAPGRVVLVRGTDATVVADRVPGGGFTLRADGQTLIVQLETYYATSEGTVARESVRRAVFLGRGDE